MLGALVEVFGNFVREIYVIPIAVDVAEVSFPANLNGLHDVIGHHIVPLLLLARTDRDFAPSEHDVIVAHCLSLARQQGFACGDTHIAALRGYTADYRPALPQLDAAIARLSRCGHGEFAALVDAAQELVAADGVSRPEEVEFLARLRGKLDKLPSAAGN